jgi:HEAT repeat protein
MPHLSIAANEKSGAAQQRLKCRFWSMAHLTRTDAGRRICDTRPSVRIGADGLRDAGTQSRILLSIVLGFSAVVIEIATSNEVAAQVAQKNALAFAESLNSENPKVRYNAVRALAKLGPKAQPAIASLIAALKDYGAPVDDDLQYLGPRVRDAASDALAQIGQPTVLALLKALGHKDEAIRDGAARTLGKLGPLAQESFPALKAAISESQDWVRSSVIRAIGRVGQHPKVVVPLLSQVFRDEKEYVARMAALEALHDADPDGTFAIPVLVEGLKDPDGAILGAAARTLGQFGRNAKTAVPALTEALRSKQQRWGMHFHVGFRAPVRIDVARALGEIGPNALPAVLSLNRMMNEDEDQTARVWAAAAVARITPKDARSESALRILVGTLRNGNGQLQAEAADALGATRCEAAIAALADALSTPESIGFGGRRAHCAEVLGRIGPEAKSAVPALRKALQEQDVEMGFINRQQAAVALGKIGNAAKAAIPDLKRASTSDYEPLRESAIEAIKLIKSRAEEPASSNQKHTKLANPEFP